MNATEMRELTEKADRLREVQLKAEEAEAELKRQETDAEHKPWWESTGIPQLRGRIRRGAQRGCRFQTERLSRRHGCPEYVVDYFKDRGFEVDVSGDGDMPQVITIRWQEDDDPVDDKTGRCSECTYRYADGSCYLSVCYFKPIKRVIV